MRTIHISMTSKFQCEYCQCFTFKRYDKFKLKCTSHVYSAHYFGNDNASEKLHRNTLSSTVKDYSDIFWEPHVPVLKFLQSLALLFFFCLFLFLFLLFPGNFSRQEKKRFLHKYTEKFKSECLVTGYISLLSLERNSVLSELTFQLFEYDFKTMSLRSQKTPHRLCLFSRVTICFTKIHWQQDVRSNRN